HLYLHSFPTRRSSDLFLCGIEFWSAADRACDWLEGRGMAVPDLRRDIAASRFGGSPVDIESVRRRLIERISRAQPAGTPWWMPRDRKSTRLNSSHQMS